MLELADTVLVMANGCIVHETDANSSDRTTLGRYMTGHVSQSVLLEDTA